MQFQKNIQTPPTEGIGIPWGEGVWGSVGPKKLKKCMKLDWNFQRGGVLKKNPFRGGGMDIFWNCTTNVFTWSSDTVI